MKSFFKNMFLHQPVVASETMSEVQYIVQSSKVLKVQVGNHDVYGVLPFNTILVILCFIAI